MCDWNDGFRFCGRECQRGERFCCFHLDERDKPDFASEFAQLLAKQERDFRGFVFPADFELHSQNLKHADFTDALFKGQANLSGNTFVQVKFERTVFEHGVIFGGLGNPEQGPYL